MPSYFYIGGFLLFGDIYNIKDRIRAMRDNFDIRYDKNQMQYIVTHKGFHFMTVPIGELDDRVIKHIRKVVWLNNHNELNNHIDEHNAKIERQKEKAIEEMAHQMAKDLRKPLLNNYEFGT